MATAYRSSLDKINGSAIVKSLTVTQQPTKTVYMEGEPLDLTGFRASAVVDPFSGEVTGYVTTTPADEQPVPAGISDILVKYGNAIASVPITVYGIDEIEITTQPTTTEYMSGDTLDLTGIVVTGYANNRAMSTDITDLCTFSPADGDTLSTSGSQTITVSYKGMTDTTSVDVYEYDTLTVTSMPTKTVYQPNETLDLTGVSIIVSASGTNFSEDVTSQCIFSPSNGTVLNEVKTYTISATYNGLSTSFDVKCKTLPTWDNRGLEYNDWDVIQTYAQFGQLGTVANLGDTKTITSDGGTLIMELVSINDGSVLPDYYPANTADFLSKTLTSKGYATTDNFLGWADNSNKIELNSTFYDSLSLKLQESIVEKAHYYVNSFSNSTNYKLSEDKIWLPTSYEITGNTYNDSEYYSKPYTVSSISSGIYPIGSKYNGSGVWYGYNGSDFLNSGVGWRSNFPRNLRIGFRIG